MPVRTNPLKASLRAGRTELGTWITLSRNPAVMHLLKSVGLGFVQIDMEHCPPSIETVADLAMAGRALDLPVLVRPPVGNREWISRILDAGAWGIYVPQIETPEQAYEVVQAARHAPIGNRGTFEPGPQNDYTEPGDPTGSLGFLNEQVHITVMLESKAAFEHLDDIVGMEGIDSVGVGAYDLAQDLGVYDEPNMERVVTDYRVRLSEATTRFGKALSIFITNTEELEQWTRAGAGLVCFQTDAWVIRSNFAAAVSHCRDFARGLR